MKTYSCLPYSHAPAPRLKAALSFDLLGFTTGRDGSTAKHHQEIGLLVIKATLNQSGHIPKTHFDNAESFKAYFNNKNSILIDATEPCT